MFRKLFIAAAALLIAAFLSSASAFAQVNFKGGVAERMRHEYWSNNWDMENHHYDKGDRNYFRLKTSFWGQADYENLGLYAKMTNENKAYTFYGGSADKKYHYDIDEVVFDNLYLDLNKPMDLPVSIRMGRQDFLGPTGYGEGFLIADGTPMDGSRTYYFNALKTSWTVNERNTLDFIYINNPRSDIYLPVINKSKPTTQLNYTDEQAYVFYLKNKGIKNLCLEPYYIYKTEGYTGGSGLQAQRGYINTLGAFGKYNLDPWTLRAQLADQFGKYGDNDRFGLGGYAFVDRDFKETVWSPGVTAGVVYLSGDDKKTDKNEGWDPLFSRYPWFSELYQSAFTGESGPAYWTNLQMYRLGVSANPAKKMKLSFFYNFLRANETIPASSTYSYSGKGKDRGHLEQARIDYTFSKNVAAYFLAEYFQPKDVYTSSADDAVFLRTEIQIKF